MDLSAFNDAMKDYYTGERTQEVMIRDRPLLGLLTKQENFGGRKLPIPLLWADPENVSSSFSESQGRSSNGTAQVEAFDLTRTKLYNTVDIDTEVMEASEGDTAAWLEARYTEVDGALEAISNRLAQLAYRAGWGEIGTVGAINAATITLSNIADVHNFAPKMRVVFASSLASSVLRGASQYLEVTGVNRNTGVVTFSANVATITGGGGVVAVSDYIFTKGDRQDSATPARQVVCGLEGWAPATAPSSGESFFSVDRSVDSRLYGLFYNGTADAPEDAILEAANRMAEVGRKATHAFVSYRQFSKIVKNQRTLERFLDKVTATVGFEGVVIMGARGPIKVVPDQFCPNNRAFVVELPMLKLYSLKKAVRVIDNDGMMALRHPTLDAIQVRCGFKGNLGCRAPNAICTVSLTAV